MVVVACSSVALAPGVYRLATPSVVHCAQLVPATPSMFEPVSTHRRNGEPPIVKVPVNDHPQPASGTATGPPTPASLDASTGTLGARELHATTASAARIR